MNKKSVSQLVRWVVTATAIVVPLAILLWLNQGAVSAFIDVVRDREAVIAYLDTLGAIGPLVLMGLIGLQVLIPSLPAEPPMMASAYAYGFTAGFLMSWVISVAVSQAVFCLARYAGRPLVERLVPAKLLGKWTRTAGERGTMFFLLAFVIPPVPSDILIYVAGLSEIQGWHFFVANLFGRMPMIVLLTLVGAYGFSITPAIIVGLTAIGIFMLVAWLYYVRQSVAIRQPTHPGHLDLPHVQQRFPFLPGKVHHELSSDAKPLGKVLGDRRNDEIGVFCLQRGDLDSIHQSIPPWATRKSFAKASASVTGAWHVNPRQT